MFQILKDIILRYKVLRRVRVRYRPGWDCHGLPIELKALAHTADDHTRLQPLTIRKAGEAAYMNKSERKFRTDKFDKRNKFKPHHKLL